MGEGHLVASRAVHDRREELAPRCPYCREDVRLELQAWTACALCLARHHGSCWDELGLCASCGDRSRLAPVDVPERVEGPLGLALTLADGAHRLLGILIGGAGISLLFMAAAVLVLGSLEKVWVGALALSGGGGLLLAVGLALRAASLRWSRRPRAFPLPLLAALAVLGCAATVGLHLIGLPHLATWVETSAVAWTVAISAIARVISRDQPRGIPCPSAS